VAVGELLTVRRELGAAYLNFEFVLKALVVDELIIAVWREQGAAYLKFESCTVLTAVAVGELLPAASGELRYSSWISLA